MTRVNLEAVPGERITLDADPDGWPFHVRIGDVEQGAMPERYRDRRGIKARVSVTVPQLGQGQWPLKLRDRNGVHELGTVTIR